MKRFCPAKRSRKAERRLEKFDRSAKRCEHRMLGINNRILSRLISDRRRRRDLKEWEKEPMLFDIDPRPTSTQSFIMVPGTASTSWFPVNQTITCETTVRKIGW